MSADKPLACAAAFNSPMMPPAPENSPSQPHSFRSPFLLSGPPDVFSSPSVRCNRSAETSRRRSSPFPHSVQHSSKKMKLNSTELPPEPGVSPPPVVNNMSPLSPIRSPTEDNSYSTLPEMPSESSEFDADSNFSISSDLSDSQVSSAGAQVCSPGSETSSSLLESPSNQVTSASDSSLPSFGPLEDSPLPEPTPADYQSPVLPESPASSSSPLASSPPYELQSYPAPVEDLPDPEVQSSESPASSSSPLASSPPYELQSYPAPVEDPPDPDVQSSSLPESENVLQESEMCSPTVVPASVADLPSSSVSSPTEVKIVDEDGEIESGEKSVETANSQDVTESSAEARGAYSRTETAHSSSDEGTVF